MNKQFITAILLFICIGLYGQPKTAKMYNYETQWKEVAKFEKDDLPKSAATVVDNILKQAISEKNTQQVIKSLIYKNRYQIVIDSDNNLNIFTDLEDLLQKTVDTNQRSLLHSMLGELYLQYYGNNRWQIDQRTSLNDFVPEDIHEWSKNIFYQKAIAHFNESVLSDVTLLGESTSDYKDIILHGKDSDTYYPTLFDFLIKRCIDLTQDIRYNNFEKILQQKGFSLQQVTAPTSDFIALDIQLPATENDLPTLYYYKRYLTSLSNRNMPETLVLTELSRNDYLQSIARNYSEDDSLAFLKNLFEKYKNNDIAVEIIDRIVGKYQRYGRTSDKDDMERQAQAYEWCKKGIEMYPAYKRINILKSKLASLEQPYATVNGDDAFHPERKPKKLTLEYKNLKSLTARIMKVGGTQPVLVKEIKMDLSPKTTYLSETKEIDLDFLDNTGKYSINFTFDRKVENNSKPEIYITRLMVLSRALSEKEYEFYVVDRLTGMPVNGATITIEKEKKPLTKIQTNNQGFVTYTSDVDLNKDYSLRDKYSYKVSLSDDNAGIVYNFPYGYRFSNSSRRNSQQEKSYESTNVFTDRSIYRPGQTVYFKVIMSLVDKGQTSLITNKSYKVELYNGNRQLVSDKTLITNEFGSISGEFILPQGGITGSFFIKVNGIMQYFTVEEYKRPTFQITFDKIDKTYTFGERVTVVGHAESYSGVKLQNATVSYNVTKNSLWRYYNTENITAGEVVTKDDGSFEVTFTIPKDNSNIMPLWRNIYSYRVSASVTDVNGETQTGDYSFAVGSVSMTLTTDIPEKINKKAIDKIEIKAANLDGQEIPAVRGAYILYGFMDNDTIKKEILRNEFVTGDQKPLVEKLKSVPSGKYMIRLQANDSNGKNVEAENTFILYSDDDKRPPFTSNEWDIVKSNTFSKDKNAEIILGISAKNVTVLYELLKDEKVLDRKQLKMSNENKLFTIPYADSYGDGITAAFTYVIEEKIYQKTYSLTREKENKQLTLKLEVFRDKLRPGQQEEWRISVKDNQNKPALAELLASMYDSSLDKLMKSPAWSISPLVQTISNPILLSSDRRTNGVYMNWYFSSQNIKYPYLTFDNINWFGFNFNGYMILQQARSVVAGAPVPSSARGEVMVDQMDLAESATEQVEFSASWGQTGTLGKVQAKQRLFSNKSLEAETGGGSNGSSPDVQIRQNFSETAFFYPQLRTDKNGETIISFTVPESNTTWRLRALAHDKNLASGALEALAVSRKELMVTPNMPRFMRQGDRTTISTKISNLSDNAISGKVRIEFFDPLTDLAVALPVSDQVKSFSVGKDASGSAEWTFNVPADIDLIGCRIIAESESFSDGEQHVVSVLPNRMLVTESMTMNVNGAQTKDFVFEKLVNNKSKSLSNYRLTLEYASNPAWYAIQALPVLSNPVNENAVDWFASYYVNTLGSFITVQYPKVSAMIDAWKKQGGTKETLVSKLMKNEELKAVLLEETPWVLDAKNETEQMQRLSLLFDLNNTRQQTSTAIDKLKELQNDNGAWSWFRGFYPGRSITQYILYGFTELIHLNAVQYPEDVKVMQMKAIRYIDEQIRKDYSDLKKQNKDLQKMTAISTSQLEYLYVRSGYRDIPIDQETRAAERFYTSVVEKNWTKINLYERSLLAVLAKRNGNKELAAKIMQSLREYATVNDEMGMFWANNRSHVFMSQSAVSVHVFIMDAFKEAGNATEKEMDLMKQWLLKQKQTAVWETTHATIDAIYGLLGTGSDWFNSSGTVDIKLGNEIVKPENKESGTGYFKQTWDKNEIKNNMGKVEVKKTDNGPSYGALYWQYYENTDAITAQKGELNVDKKLFIETSSVNGKGLNQITESSPLKVGDKAIVRLTVQVDRDMEFVHLKDMRASCFEPAETLSGTKWQNGIVYYQAIKDASTNFYFDNLPKGTYVFEYPVYVTRTGEYSNGITTIQCMYAPEFVSHTAGIRIVVK